MRLHFMLAAGVCAACATTGPAPAGAPGSVTRAEPEPVRVERGPSVYQAEIGGLSQFDVERELEGLLPELEDCVHRAASSMSYLGGRVSLRMRLDSGGNVRWAYLKETTLGDRETERCMLTLVKSRTWPRPLSGEGLAETSFDVDPADTPRTLPSYESARLAARARAVTRRCRRGLRGDFVATAYFDRRGEVLSVGVAPPDETGESAADCVAEALRDLRVVSPPSASKVSFRISP